MTKNGNVTRKKEQLFSPFAVNLIERVNLSLVETDLIFFQH